MIICFYRSNARYESLL